MFHGGGGLALSLLTDAELQEREECWDAAERRAGAKGWGKGQGLASVGPRWGSLVTREGSPWVWWVWGEQQQPENNSMPLWTWDRGCWGSDSYCFCFLLRGLWRGGGRP